MMLNMGMVGVFLAGVIVQGAEVEVRRRRGLGRDAK